jgi:glycerol-3-phosphate dehydrogenase
MKKIETPVLVIGGGITGTGLARKHCTTAVEQKKI